MSVEGRLRVEESLASRERCGMLCKNETCNLTRRKIGHVVTVYLQCDRCGAAVGGALPRSQHHFWQDYPEWNADLAVKWEGEWKRQADETARRRREAREAEWDTLRADYARFCRESPEWSELRNMVIERADGVCEACLVNRAVTAHHLTYEKGPLPPAWELRAVCKQCHARLHARKKGTTDEWDPDRFAFLVPQS